MALTQTQLLVLVTKLRPVIGKTFRLLLAQSAQNTGQTRQYPLNVFMGSSSMTQHWEPFLSHNLSVPPQCSSTSGLLIVCPHLRSAHSVPTFPTLPSSSSLLVKSGGGWAGMSPCFLAEENSLQQGKQQQVSSVPLVTFSPLKNGRKRPGSH